MPGGDLTCAELVELVTDYLEGALPYAERRRLEAHLRDCSGCEAYIEQFRTTIGLTGALREEHVDGDAAEALLPVFRDWRERAT